MKLLIATILMIASLAAAAESWSKLQRKANRNFLNKSSVSWDIVETHTFNSPITKIELNYADDPREFMAHGPVSLVGLAMGSDYDYFEVFLHTRNEVLNCYGWTFSDDSTIHLSTCEVTN